jgi:hypothetical protein
LLLLSLQLVATQLLLTTIILRTHLHPGTFTPSRAFYADYLVVAGGGGGGGISSRRCGGGGGAGGLRSTVTATGGGGSLESALSLNCSGYTVTVGAGGSTNSRAVSPTRN